MNNYYFSSENELNNNVLAELINQNKMIKTQADISEKTIQEMINIRNQIRNIADEVKFMKDEVTNMKGEVKEAVHIAQVTLQEIKNHIKLSDVQCEDIQKAVSKKAYEFTQLAYPEIFENKERDPELFSRKYGYVKRGIWSIIKLAANGNRGGSYKHIRQELFEPTMKFIEMLSFRDYLDHRSFKPLKLNFHITKNK